MRWLVALSLILTLLLAAGYAPFKTPFGEAASSAITAEEQQIISFVNGSEAYEYDLELEEISERHFACRSGGTSGAEEAALWLKGQLESLNISTRLEPFNFSTWNLTSKPSMLIDEDADLNTTTDQVNLESFESSWMSPPTPQNGTLADVVVLPLPDAENKTVFDQVQGHPAWPEVISGRILLLGQETLWKWQWVQELQWILNFQTPAAFVYTWWYEWAAPTSPNIPWTQWSRSPVGIVGYDDGLMIRERENASDISAFIKLDSETTDETHYNVVGEIRGCLEPEKKVIISSHYDTINCNGFCDNGAGTAGVLEIAKVVSEAVRTGIYRPKYTILFVMFTTEEYYLVGSANYVMQHKDDMPNIVAVINLDCIGSDDMFVTQTEPSTILDLDQTLVAAAQDLNMTITVEINAASDHETFRDPVAIAEQFQMIWGLDANISDAIPVNASSMIYSEPLYPADVWTMGVPGCIHTSYDNSTSTATMSWVEIDDLGNHIRFATLATIRVSQNIPSPDIDHSGIVDMRDIAAVCRAFGSERGDDEWNYLLDLNADGIVNMRDISIACLNFMKHFP